MTLRLLAAAAAIAFLVAPPISAQTTGGSFDSLSPGNQKIANALFSSQSTSGTPLTRDQIADLKRSEGWGKVFQQMKTDGRIQAKNLGQVVSTYQHTLNAERRGTTTSTAASSARRSGTASASASSHRRTTYSGHRYAATYRGWSRSYGHAAMGGYGHGGGVVHGFGGGMGGGFGHGFGGGGMGGGGHGGGRGH